MSRRSRPHPSKPGFSRIIEQFSTAVTKWTGSTMAFALASLTIIVWAVTGPIFGYSNTWQLVINTGTTIMTFLMVFLIQRAQNKDTQAIELKLNEIVAAMAGASNHLIDVRSQRGGAATLRRHYATLAKLAKKGSSSNDVALGRGGRRAARTKDRGS